jgi:hypothetical protein
VDATDLIKRPAGESGLGASDAESHGMAIKSSARSAWRFGTCDDQSCNAANWKHYRSISVAATADNPGSAGYFARQVRVTVWDWFGCMLPGTDDSGPTLWWSGNLRRGTVAFRMNFGFVGLGSLSRVGSVCSRSFAFRREIRNQRYIPSQRRDPEFVI